MQITPLALDGVRLLTPTRHRDDRGFVCETYNRRTLEDAGLPSTFAQDTQAVSLAPYTLRGLHAQLEPHAQGKLVRCGRGRFRDVVVDARAHSPTYGEWLSVELSAHEGQQLWIPAGFLHGFVTLEPNTETLYKLTAPYAPTAQGAVRFDDPDLGIDWAVSSDALVLSDRDRTAPLFADFPPFHQP